MQQEQVQHNGKRQVVKVGAESQKGRRGHDAAEKRRSGNPKDRRVGGKEIQERVSSVNIVTAAVNDNPYSIFSTPLVAEDGRREK
jgi:hypothetical protein